MAQRVLFMIAAGEPGCIPDAAMFSNENLQTGSLPAAPALFPDRGFFEAVSNAGLVLCAVGREWLPVLPPHFRGIAIAKDPSGWQVIPTLAAARVRAWLPAPAAAGRMDAAAAAMLNEPWDLFALRLPAGDAAQTAQIARRLEQMMNYQTADVVVIALFLPASGQGSWLMRTPAGREAHLPPAPADILPVILSVLGVQVPGSANSQSPGSLLEQPAGPTADELEIQQHLKNLGYI